MFDTYMHAHGLDPQLRRRMTLALGGAVIASAAMIVGYAGAERLSISRVGAPSVELDFLMAETVASPLAAPPPPAPPEQAAASDTPASDDDPPPPDDRPADFLDPSPRRSSTSSVPSHAKGGVPGGPTGMPTMPTGMPCLGGNCSIGTPKPLPLRPQPPAIESAKVPLDVARGRATVSPNPPQAELLATRAGSMRRGGTSVVEYCVGTDGKVDKVSTKRSAGDGDVDRICRETMRRWSFTPLSVDNRPTRMCSEVAFVISFE